jgi:hypothetical protein
VLTSRCHCCATSPVVARSVTLRVRVEEAFFSRRIISTGPTLTGNSSRRDKTDVYKPPRSVTCMSRDAVFSVRPYTALSPSTFSPSTVMTRTESNTFQLKTRKTKYNSTQVAGFSATVRRSRQPSALSIIVAYVIATSTFLFLLNVRSTSAMTIGASDSISGQDSDTLTAGTTTLTGVDDSPVVVSPHDRLSSAAWTSEYSESAQQEVRPHRHDKRDRQRSSDHRVGS